MGDIFDRAQELDEQFRRETLDKHFAKNKIATPPESRLAMTSMDCEDCGKQIPKARLKANPMAIRCVPCQTKYERGGIV
jgi:DnaK suppressor protein